MKVCTVADYGQPLMDDIFEEMQGIHRQSQKPPSNWAAIYDSIRLYPRF